MPESDSDDFESADEDVDHQKSSKETYSKVTKSEDVKPQSEISETMKKSNSGSSWRSWGAFEMISSASKSVASVTTKVSQSLTTAIESMNNIPDPEEMAKMQVEDKKTKQDELFKNEQKSEEEASGFKLDSLLSNVSLISSKVVSGGLETLEGIGKKTMNIIQETDPNIKNKLRNINSSNRPNLSELLQEAKYSDAGNDIRESEIKVPLVSFEHILEEYSGLVYLEALEILSKQSKMKIELLMKPLTGKSLADMDETLKEVEELYELPDSDSVNDKVTTATLGEHLAKAIEDLSIALNVKEIVNYSLKLDKQFEESNVTEKDHKQIYNNCIDALAKLCALSLNNYQKMAELMLSLSHRSTADEVDAIIQLTSIYFSLFNYVATKFSEKIANSNDETKNMSMEMFIECSNAISYVKKAFGVFIPILQIGAL
ncbi:protein FAM114A2 [Chironomus tepperi]|uniref:protein FAM114A2 n=1 Tax=Chironomus tepperi TaxID=113505 RepID=UPI00391F1DD1